MITQERLKEVLNYDPETGMFTWKEKISRKVVLGRAAGALTWNGYIIISIEGETIRAHRLAWLYVHGVMPEDDIDHINGVRHDNRLGNLRSVTRSHNLQNRRAVVARSGHIGAYKNKKQNKFYSFIRVNGAKVWLGMHDTAEQASAAFFNAKKQYHEGAV